MIGKQEIIEVETVNIGAKLEDEIRKLGFGKCRQLHR
jgi:hypothetical protein